VLSGRMRKRGASYAEHSATGHITINVMCGPPCPSSRAKISVWVCMDAGDALTIERVARKMLSRSHVSRSHDPVIIQDGAT
jgi:hypothetical protein